MTFAKKLGLLVGTAAIALTVGVSAQGAGTQVAGNDLPCEYSIKQVAGNDLPCEYSIRQVAGNDLPCEYSIQFKA